MTPHLSPAGPRPHPARVLIVEDNPVDRSLFKRLLRQQDWAGHSFEYYECEFGSDALAHVHRVHPDCVLLDLNLPDMDGVQVLQSIVRDAAACPVIVMTAYGTEEIAVEAMKSGAADYLVKGSISYENLGRTIQNALAKRDLERTLEARNRELELALRRYRTLADAMPQVVWSAGPDGAWDYINEQWPRLTGAPAAEALGGGWLRFVDERDRPAITEAWSAALLNSGSVEWNFRIVSPEGPRWQLMRAVPSISGPSVEDGSQFKWIGTLTDMEDRKRAENLLHESQKLESIGILAGGVAHDFNNLLVGIIGGTSYALDVLPTGHELRPILEAALRSGERAADLTRQLLAYAGKGAFQPGNVDLNETLRSTWDLLQASIPRSVQLKAVLPDDLAPVYADPTQLQQIVMNLILNAAEAIPRDRPGLVAVRARNQEIQNGDLAPGRYIVMEVRDNGSGIQPDVLHKIFDPFFTTKFTGRGLGLAAVHGIVRSNRGAIEVESTPGQGATFRVFLPAGTKASRPPAPEAAAPEKAKSKTRVLLIDDEPMVRRVARTALERAGYDVITASGGEDALGKLESLPGAFSLVILDYNMPGMTGEQTFDAVRSIRPDLPIAICSGYGEAEIRAVFAHRKVAGFLQKPFRAGVLISKVSELLSAAKT